MSFQFAPRALLFALLPVLWTPPAAAQQEGGKLFAYEQIELDNGLKVVTLEDFSAPIVAVHLWYHVGSKDEDPERTGFAHMFEHMMFRGTDRLGPTDHFDYIRRTGGSTNAYTAFDQTVYVQTLPADQLELVLWLEAERMAFLKIDQEAFDTERKVVEEERRLGLNQPYGTVPEQVLPQVIKEHPYRWLPIGNIAHLRASSVAELRDFWTRYYVPNNATLVIVGAVEHARAQALARKYFEWIPPYAEPARVDAPEPPTTQPTDITVQAKNAPAPVAGLLARTVPVGHADAAALQMLASIYGGGESSRIYRRIVAEDRSAVQAAAVAFNLEQDGILAAGAVLPPFGSSTDAVLTALREELARLRDGLVSEREMLKARNQALRGVVTQLLTVSSKARSLGSAAVLEDDASSVNDQLAEIRAVTRETLQRVARKYLAPERLFSITVQRNLMGTLLGGGSSDEEDAPITAEPETDPPPPGRPGLERPEDFPTEPPVAEIATHDLTPTYETAHLENGLTLHVVENHEVPFVTMQLGWNTGAWVEEKPGTASMAMQMLTKGTTTRSEGELAEELETYAISLGGRSGMDAATVSASCLTEYVGRAVTLLADVVRNPTFPEEEFDKLREQVITELTVSTAEPSYLAERALRRQMFGDHPYARTATGEIADVEGLTVADVKSWWRMFGRPDGATLIFAGDVTLEQARELVEAALGDWRPTGPVFSLQPPGVPERRATHVYVVDRPGEQCQIRVGQIGITRRHPAYFASRVVSGYFGGAFNARLNETIRVKKGLTYGARGGFQADRFVGTFEISTFSKVATTVEAVQAIFDEIDRLRTEPPSEDELARTKSYLLGSTAADRETPQQVAGDLWLIELNGLPRDYFTQLLDGISSTSPEDCQRLAKQLVNPGEMVVVVVGPAGRIADNLSAIGPVTVVNTDGAIVDQ